MNRILISILVAIMLFFPASALAESPVVIDVMTTPTPDAVPAPPTPEPQPRNYVVFPWTQGDIDTMAQGYWKWCNTETEKRDFTMVAVNRMLSPLTRADGSRLFPDTIEGVMTQSGEFDIGDARCSDKNRVLAEQYLNMCMTQKFYGNAGIDVPPNAIYAGRISGTLTFMGADGSAVWRCR